MGRRAGKLPWGLTLLETEILLLLSSFLEVFAEIPTRRDLVEYFDLPNVSSAEYHLRSLERKGWIALDSHQAKGIRLLRQLRLPSSLPVLGTVADGGRVEFKGGPPQ